MANADDIALADEKMRFTEDDAAIDQLRGARHDEQRVAILLQFGPLMRMLGVLDRKVMQVELRLDAQEQLAAGFQQADPDDMPVLGRPLAGLLDEDVGNALARCVDAGSDDPGLGRGWLELADVIHRHLPAATPSLEVQTRDANLA